MEKPLSLAELRDKLKYFLDVTGERQGAFAKTIYTSGSSISQFLHGKGMRTSTRLCLEAEMKKRGWLVEEKLHL